MIHLTVIVATLIVQGYLNLEKNYLLVKLCNIYTLTMSKGIFHICQPPRHFKLIAILVRLSTLTTRFSSSTHIFMILYKIHCIVLGSASLLRSYHR